MSNIFIIVEKRNSCVGMGNYLDTFTVAGPDVYIPGRTYPAFSSYAQAETYLKSNIGRYRRKDLSILKFPLYQQIND